MRLICSYSIHIFNIQNRYSKYWLLLVSLFIKQTCFGKFGRFGITFFLCIIIANSLILLENLILYQFNRCNILLILGQIFIFRRTFVNNKILAYPLFLTFWSPLRKFIIVFASSALESFGFQHTKVFLKHTLFFYLFWSPLGVFYSFRLSGVLFLMLPKLYLNNTFRVSSFL